MLNTSFKYVLEIACFNVQSCAQAQEAGADRIEFCDNYSLGGITPSQNDIVEAKKLLHKTGLSFQANLKITNGLLNK